MHKNILQYTKLVTVPLVLDLDRVMAHEKAMKANMGAGLKFL